ncbi:MAG TPA: hypothetical protein VFN07_04485, partial [Trueperaceae bacterium]|nr:hypothetical protein [Trueperaceae bacterium]
HDNKACDEQNHRTYDCGDKSKNRAHAEQPIKIGIAGKMRGKPKKFRSPKTLFSAINYCHIVVLGRDGG